MPNKEARVVFGYTIDESSVKRQDEIVKQNIAQLEKANAASIASGNYYHVAEQASLQAQKTFTESKAKEVTAETSLQKAIKETTRISEGFAAAQADVARQQYVSGIAGEWREVIAATKDADAGLRVVEAHLRAISATDDEIRQVAQDIGQISTAGNEASSGGLRGILQGAGRGLSALPGAGVPQELSGIANAGAFLSGLGPLATAAAGGTALLGAGLSLLIQRAREGTEAVKVATDAQAIYFELLQSGTRDSITAERERIASQLAVQQQLVDYYTNLLGQASVDINAAYGLLAPVIKAGEGLGLASGQAKGYIDALSDADNQTRTLTATLAAYDRALESTDVAVNTSRANYERFQHSVFENERDRLDFQRHVDQLTAEERATRIGEINNELKQLEALQAAHLDNAETFQYTVSEIGKLNLELETLNAVVDSAADKTARLLAAQEAATANSDALLKALENEGKARQALADAEAALADTRQKTAEKITGIESDLSEKLGQISDKRSEAQAEALDAQAALVEQTEERIKRIREKASDDIETAIRRGDAVAAREAKKRRDQDIRDEQTSAERQQDAIDKRLAKSLEASQKEEAAARQSAESRIEEARRAGEEELAKRQHAYDQAKVDLDNALAAERILQQQHHTTQQSAEDQHQKQLTTIATAGHTVQQAEAARLQAALLNITLAGGAGIQAAWSAMLVSIQASVTRQASIALLGIPPGQGGEILGASHSGGGSAGLGGGSGFATGRYQPFIPHFAEGGVVTRSGIAYVHQFERVTPAGRAPLPAGGGDMSVHVDLSRMTINAGSGDTAAMVREVERQIVPKIAKAVADGVRDAQR